MADGKAIRLLEQALFLRENGERPPGAPHDKPQAETWGQLWRDIETYLRGRLDTGGCAGNTGPGVGELQQGGYMTDDSFTARLRALADEMTTDGDDYVEHYGGRLREILGAEPDAEHQVVGCVFMNGSKDMPPGPEDAKLYIAASPGGYLAVGDGIMSDGTSPCLRLGPGAVIKALDDGGFVICVPGKPEPAISPPA